MEKLSFGELELSIMAIVKKMGRVTVRDVYKALGSRGSYTTIMTVMSRLAKKNDLSREKKGKQYVYWATSSPQKSSSNNFLKYIQNKIFGGKKSDLVSYLLEMEQEISDKELEEIEQLIQKRRLKNKNH